MSEETSLQVEEQPQDNTVNVVPEISSIEPSPEQDRVEAESATESQSIAAKAVPSDTPSDAQSETPSDKASSDEVPSNETTEDETSSDKASSNEAKPGETTEDGTSSDKASSNEAKPGETTEKAAPRRNRRPRKLKKSLENVSLEVGQELKGSVKTITDFGAFVNVNLPQDGLLHISELSRGRVEKVEDVVEVGQEIVVWVKNFDKRRGRIGLTMVKPAKRRYSELQVDDQFEGEVKRIADYGIFVDVGLEREGFVHISELAHDYVKTPGDVVEIGDTVQVKVLKVNSRKKQVNLSMKALLDPPVVDEPEPEPEPEPELEIDEAFDDEIGQTAMSIAFSQLEEGRRSSRRKSKHSKRSRYMEDVITKTLREQEG